MSRLSGRALGLDVGERRIGVAIADELGLIASPFAVVLRSPKDLKDIRDLALKKDVERVVVGLPTGMSGREGPQAATVRAFVDELAKVLGPDLPIVFWDERLTTAVAERALRGQGNTRSRRKGEIDAMAAAVILQGYLDANRSRTLPWQAPNSGEAG
jgi:putative Holliday junction resolvase